MTESKGHKLLRVGVVGAGRMGRHHARIYRELDGCELIAVIDKDLSRAQEVCAQYGGRAAARFSDVAGNVDAISVAVPTVYHAEVAIPLMERGIPVLVEKPLAQDTQSARQLLEASRRLGCLLQVGHSERFNPVVQAMLRMGVQPRFIETQRVSPFTFRSADIGVVFDMMIHDIDIVLHLAEEATRRRDEGTKGRRDDEDGTEARRHEGTEWKDEGTKGQRGEGADPQSAINWQSAIGNRQSEESAIGRRYTIDAVGVNVLGDCEDVANARVRFAGGAVANLTASRLALKTERRIRVFCPTAYLTMDYQKKTGIAIKLSDNLDLVRMARERNFEDLSQMAALDYGSMVKIEPLVVDDVEPLRAEIEAFVHSVRTDSAAAVSAEEGYAAVEMAERITHAVREQGLAILT